MASDPPKLLILIEESPLAGPAHGVHLPEEVAAVPVVVGEAVKDWHKTPQDHRQVLVSLAWAHPGRPGWWRKCSQPKV